MMRLRILVLFLVPLCCATGTEAASLWGLVRDAASGKPLVAHISIAHTDSPHLRFLHARSDSNGFFRVAGLASGEKIVVVRAEGYGWAWKSVVLQSGEELGGFEFLLERAAIVEGKVEDDQGNPVEGATVRLFPANLPPVQYEFMISSGRTDKDGIYRIRDATPGKDLYILVSHSDFQPNWSDTAIQLKREERLSVSTIQLRPGLTVNGEVLDAEGNPVSSAEIRSIPNRLSRSLPKGLRTVAIGSPGHRSTRTGGDGRFEISGLPQGKYSLVIRHRQFVTFLRKIEADSTITEAISLNIRLELKTAEP